MLLDVQRHRRGYTHGSSSSLLLLSELPLVGTGDLLVPCHRIIFVNGQGDANSSSIEGGFAACTDDAPTPPPTLYSGFAIGCMLGMVIEMMNARKRNLNCRILE